MSNIEELIYNIKYTLIRLIFKFLKKVLKNVLVYLYQSQRSFVKEITFILIAYAIQKIMNLVIFNRSILIWFL